MGLSTRVSNCNVARVDNMGGRTNHSLLEMELSGTWRPEACAALESNPNQLVNNHIRDSSLYSSTKRCDKYWIALATQLVCGKHTSNMGARES